MEMSESIYETKDGRKIVIINPGEWVWNVEGGYRPHHRGGGIWIYQFGAYGTTWLAVWGANIEDTLEEAAQWLLEHARGQITTQEQLWEDKSDIEDAMGELGLSGAFEDLEDEDKWAVQDRMTVDMTYTESGYIASWEWYVNEICPGDALYKPILVESVREDPDLDEYQIEAYNKALKMMRTILSGREKGNG